MPVPGALLSAVLLLASSTPAGLAGDFLLPTGDRASLAETQVICNNKIHQCWFVSFTKPSEPVCGSDHITYNGECHLCFAVLKTPDGPAERRHHRGCPRRTLLSSPGGPARTLPIRVPGGPARTLPIRVPGGPARTLPIRVPGPASQ